MKKKIAIVGAGYTGLTIGYRLGQAGFDVTLYEKESFAGGLASGFQLDGLPLERIWHFLYMSDRDALGLAEELGVKKHLAFHDSSVSTYYDGKLFPFSTPLDLLRFKPLAFWNRIRTGLVALYLRRLRNWRPLTRVTALDWMRKTAGRQATKVIWEPLLKGKFGDYYDKVIMSWLWGRISIRARSKENTSEKLGYFKGSFSVLTDRLKEEIEKSGGKIWLGSAVESIVRKEDQGIDIKAGEKTESYDAVVATVPTGVMGELIKSNKEVNNEYLEKLSAIEYIGAVVMVFTSDQKISPFYWHNINDPKIPFLVFLSNTVLVGEDGYDGKNLYYVGVYASPEHAYFSEKEDSVMAEWEKGIKEMFPEFDPSQIREKALFKFKNAQHIVDLGYEEKIPAYESIVPGVYLANFSQIYPDDRGINFAIQEGNKTALLIQKKFGSLECAGMRSNIQK
jgi:protoporphyrinogen oxidase